MKSSNIGGQAVLEGIMMKNRDRYAVAVRKPDGEIFVQTEEFHSVTGRYKKLTTIPFVEECSILLILWYWELRH